MIYYRFSYFNIYDFLFFNYENSNINVLISDDIKRLLISPDPETKFLGLMLCENESLMLEDINLIKNCVYRMRYEYPTQFKEMKNALEDIVLKLCPYYFWLIFDRTETDYNPDDYKII